jgi:hypothetical protein
MLTITTDSGAIPRKADVMTEMLTAVLVAVAASLLERLAVRIARSIWGALRPAAA